MLFGILFLGMIFIIIDIYHLHHEKNVLEEQKRELLLLIKNKLDILHEDKGYQNGMWKNKKLYLKRAKLFGTAVPSTTIIHAIVSVLNRYNLTPVDIHPLLQNKHNANFPKDLIVFVYEAKVIGEYCALTQFFNEILSPSFMPFITVASIELASLTKDAIDSSKPLVLKMLLYVYVDTAFADITKSDTKIFQLKMSNIKSDHAMRNPFSTEQFHRPLGLNFWSLAQLKLLGIWHDKNRNFGLIEDPEGDVYRITTGDKISTERKTVKMISHEGIICD